MKIKDFVCVFSKFYFFSLDFHLNVQNSDIIYFNLKIRQMNLVSYWWYEKLMGSLPCF